MRYEAAIFDLDGTLLNTLDDLADSVNHALAACGYPSRSREEVRQFVGNGVALLIHRSVPEGTPAGEEEHCLDAFRAHYLTNMRHKTAPYPGIPDLLGPPERRGCAVAVVSNKFDRAVKELCADYFGGRVPVAIASHPQCGKTAPDTVFAALRELDLPASGPSISVTPTWISIPPAMPAWTASRCPGAFGTFPFSRPTGPARIADSPAQLFELLIEE